ncbi:MAG: SAM-dependent DNA methyltransferase [Prevotella sp.]|nr:SAM-dependent DNA methyltransferase [Prevotella sp.]
MATTIRKNERSWAIELISQINQFSAENDLIIKRAGGESTVSEYRGQSMFPDVILYGDYDLSSILQGWELKMPDVPITDEDFVHDAKRKARALNLNSCVIWNFTHAKLYVYDDNSHDYEVKKSWRNNIIKTRNDVQTYKSRWENTLQSVLTSINEYLISGEVKKRFIGEVLTKTSISNLVNENKYNVANSLRNAANHDAIMSAHIDTWWKEIEAEYRGDETDKFAAYAKSVIINWANRIIFAHLIKRRQQSAFAIDQLDYDSTPREGNRIFQDITERSDFYNIFSVIPYNECISEKTWAQLVELSLFLKNSPINNISQRILQQVLEGSVNISKRLMNGQYPTPPTLAAILSRMTIHDVHGECFDGCCGTGTIPSFIINFKKDRGIGAAKAMATTWASDKFKMPLQIANLAMTSYDTINMPCRLFQKDILTLSPSDEVEIVNPQTGERETFSLPLFDSFVSNLPFVKSSEISDDDTPLVNAIKQANNLSGRSDFSYYIALHLKNLVKAGGYVGIILSNSFLGTDAGSKFLAALRADFDDMRIHISGNGKWFTNADIVTALLIMRRKREGVEENTSISFFTWKRNLDVIDENCEYQETIINSSLLDRELDNRVIARVNYNNEDLESLINLNVSYNSLFSNLKWLLEIEDKLVPVSSYLKVFRGSRRGWDPMFFPQSDAPIEPEFLKDVLMNARATDSYIASPTTDRKAFCCGMDTNELVSLGYRGALTWIRKFEGEVNETGRPLPHVLARSGMKWYELTTDEVAEIFTMMNPDDRMFYAKFNSPTFINQRLIGLKRIRTTDNLDLLHALLNSMLSLFYIEAVGFGRGLGVLDINKDSISKCYMLNPSLLTEQQKTTILTQFSQLVERGILDIDQDIDDPIRQEFERVVLEAFGIEDYLDDIISSLKSMRRVRKAVKKTNVQMRTLNNRLIYDTNIEDQIPMAADCVSKN